MTAESRGTVLGSHRRCLQVSEGRGLQGRPGPWGRVLETEGWGGGRVWDRGRAVQTAAGASLGCLAECQWSCYYFRVASWRPGDSGIP